MKINKKYILAGIVILGLLWMLADALFQPGISDLKGGYKEVAFVRNEQNTGPVVRLYVVTVKDTLWKEMEIYGNYMPYNKYGTTKVFFFREGGKTPASVSLDGDNIPAEYQPFCMGMYLKDAMSQVHLIERPFENQKDAPEKKILTY